MIYPCPAREENAHNENKMTILDLKLESWIVCMPRITKMATITKTLVLQARPVVLKLFEVWALELLQKIAISTFWVFST